MSASISVDNLGKASAVATTQVPKYLQMPNMSVNAPVKLQPASASATIPLGNIPQSRNSTSQTFHYGGVPRMSNPRMSNPKMSNSKMSNPIMSNPSLKMSNNYFNIVNDLVPCFWFYWKHWSACSIRRHGKNGTILQMFGINGTSSSNVMAHFSYQAFTSIIIWHS